MFVDKFTAFYWNKSQKNINKESNQWNNKEKKQSWAKIKNNRIKQQQMFGGVYERI